MVARFVAPVEGGIGPNPEHSVHAATYEEGVFIAVPAVCGDDLKRHLVYARGQVHLVAVRVGVGVCDFKLDRGVTVNGRDDDRDLGCRCRDAVASVNASEREAPGSVHGDPADAGFGGLRRGRRGQTRPEQGPGEGGQDQREATRDPCWEQLVASHSVPPPRRGTGAAAAGSTPPQAAPQRLRACNSPLTEL